jgi:hypothetical protein
LSPAAAAAPPAEVDAFLSQRARDVTARLLRRHFSAIPRSQASAELALDVGHRNLRVVRPSRQTEGFWDHGKGEFIARRCKGAGRALRAVLSSCATVFKLTQTPQWMARGAKG